MVDFWRMVWEYEAFSIVMLSTVSEKEEVCTDLNSVVGIFVPGVFWCTADIYWTLSDSVC